MDCIVHGVAKRWTRLSNLHTSQLRDRLLVREGMCSGRPRKCPSCGGITCRVAAAPLVFGQSGFTCRESVLWLSRDSRPKGAAGLQHLCPHWAACVLLFAVADVSTLSTPSWACDRLRLRHLHVGPVLLLSLV